MVAGRRRQELRGRPRPAARRSGGLGRDGRGGADRRGRPDQAAQERDPPRPGGARRGGPRADRRQDRQVGVRGRRRDRGRPARPRPRPRSAGDRGRRRSCGRRGPGTRSPAGASGRRPRAAGRRPRSASRRRARARSRSRRPGPRPRPRAPSSSPHDHQGSGRRQAPPPPTSRGPAPRGRGSGRPGRRVGPALRSFGHRRRARRPLTGLVRMPTLSSRSIGPGEDPGSDLNISATPARAALGASQGWPECVFGRPPSPMPVAGSGWAAPGWGASGRRAHDVAQRAGAALPAAGAAGRGGPTYSGARRTCRARLAVGARSGGARVAPPCEEARYRGRSSVTAPACATAPARRRR